MFMYFDMKFIRQNQKTHRNDEVLPSYYTFSGQVYRAIFPRFKTVEICLENIKLMNILFIFCDIAS